MSKYLLEIRWAVIFTIVFLLWMVLERALGWHDELIDRHATYTNLFAIPAILLFAFALRDKRRQLGGVMTWKQGFIAGVIISAIIALLSPLAQWITHTVITPDYFANAIQYGVENGLATREQAEAYFNLRNYILLSAGSGFVMGVVTAAIVALAVRRNPQPGL
jgi:hypothetical protein